MGRQGLDAHPAPDLGRRDAIGVRPGAADLQHEDGRPRDRRVRVAGDQGALPAADGRHRHLVEPGLLRARGRLRPRLRTTAVRDGDSYVVNGQKTWTTLGQYADWIFCLVRTDPQAPKRQAGISFLLIDMATPGITLRPIKLIDGGREVNEVFFQDVRVPADQLVGEENQGWTYAKFLLGNERTGIPRVGNTKVRLAEVKKHAAQTGLLEDPLFAARLAEAENELLALELTQARVVSDSADGKPNPASSVLKMRGSQLQQIATELLVEVAGPDALPVDGDDIASSRWAQSSAPRYLNYRKTSIYGGSSEVQRNIIASTILGL
jgi:alkylation response protein AidB-like acyl-CoA dehydrogenase